MALRRSRYIAADVVGIRDSDYVPPPRSQGYRDAGPMFMLKSDRCGMCAYGGGEGHSPHSTSRPDPTVDVWPPIPPKVRWPR